MRKINGCKKDSLEEIRKKIVDFCRFRLGSRHPDFGSPTASSLKRFRFFKIIFCIFVYFDETFNIEETNACV
jgi:hypothetical protein